MRRLAIALAVCLAWPPAAAGEENFTGWRFVRSLPLGARKAALSRVFPPHPVRSGASSLLVQVRPGDCARGKRGQNDCTRDRERVELKQVGDYQHPGERWAYGLSLFLPGDFTNLWPVKVYFAQFHQEGARPAVMLANDRGGLWLIVRARRPFRRYRLLAREQLRGRWLDLSLKIAWSRGDDGRIDVWLNGRKIVADRGANASAEDIYFKFGLYRAFVSRNPRAGNVSQTAYFDAIWRQRLDR